MNESILLIARKKKMVTNQRALTKKVKENPTETQALMAQKNHTEPKVIHQAKLLGLTPKSKKG